MANGKIRFGKQSGGQLTLVIPDGVTSTYLVLPESGTVASVSGAVTDNAIVRFDGTTGKVQNSGVIIDDNGNVLVTGAGALGYGTGSGGTVTQLTSKSTAVTLNKPTGQIIMNNASLAAGEEVSFSVLNSLVIGLDIPSVVAFNNAKYSVRVHYIISGSFNIAVKNNTSGTLSEALAINFDITKGANS